MYRSQSTPKMTYEVKFRCFTLLDFARTCQVTLLPLHLGWKGLDNLSSVYPLDDLHNDGSCWWWAYIVSISLHIANSNPLSHPVSIDSDLSFRNSISIRKMKMAVPSPAICILRCPIRKLFLGTKARCVLVGMCSRWHAFVDLARVKLSHKSSRYSRLKNIERCRFVLIERKKDQE